MPTVGAYVALKKGKSFLVCLSLGEDVDAIVVFTRILDEIACAVYRL